MARPVWLLALVLLGASAPAQTVYQVGPGAIAQIHEAIVMAAPGDVIVVAPGTYEPFVLNKGLTITAPGSNGAEVVSIALAGAWIDFRIPAGQKARISGLRFRSPWPFFFGLKVTVNRGLVWFEECLFEQGTHVNGAALEVRTAGVVLRRCIAVGSGGPNNQVNGGGGAGGSAMSVEDGWVSATQTYFLGGDLHFDSIGHGGHGIEARRSILHLVRCSCVGGRNSVLTCRSHPGGHGLLVEDGLGTWVSDCTLTGGDGNCGVAGDGLHNTGTSPVHLSGTNATGGAGQPASLPLFGPTRAAPLLGLGNDPGPVVLGGTYQVDWRAAPGTPVFAFLSTDLEPRSHPFFAQGTWLAGAGVTLAGIVVADPGGTASFSLPVPALPGLRHHALWLHGYAGVSVPFETSPPLGGVAR